MPADNWRFAAEKAARINGSVSRRCTKPLLRYRQAVDTEAGHRSENIENL